MRPEPSKPAFGNSALDLAPQFLGNRLAGPSVSKKRTGYWKPSAGFDPSFLETGWLADDVRFPTLSSLTVLYRCLLSWLVHFWLRTAPARYPPTLRSSVLIYVSVLM